MGSNFRDGLAVVALLGMVPIGIVVSAFAVALVPGWSVTILAVLFVVGVFGVVAGDWPLIEYLLVLLICVAFAGLLSSYTEYACCVPAAMTGYFWGGYFAGIVSPRNIERRAEEDPQQDSSSR